MSSFYTQNELQDLGFKSLGNSVLISRKASIYGVENITIGNNVRIDDFCILSGSITLGNYIHIAAYTALYGGDKGIYIDDFANISSRVCIYSMCDDFSGKTMTNPMVPDMYKNITCEPVYIEQHVIIGSTSVVLPGVRLREGSSFGSFSFINQDSEAWSINTGIPFKKIRNRSKNLLKLEKSFLQTLEL